MVCPRRTGDIQVLRTAIAAMCGLGNSNCGRTSTQGMSRLVLSLLLLPSLTSVIGISLAAAPWQPAAEVPTPAMCKACIWDQPIVGVGATSGEVFVPRKIREFNMSVLKEVDALVGLERPSGTASCPRWLVTTTINPATPNLQALARMSGWCKVFVLDKKSPPDFALDGPGVVVLSVADQEALPYRMARLLPWNHFGRKNIGYAYAFLHGAEVIYDTDDDNIIERLPNGRVLLPTSLSSDSNLHVLSPTAAADTKAFNPYPFWNTPSAWPRGFPLSLINCATSKSGATRAPDGEAGLLAADGQRTCVLQSLANTDPDVDAIFRLTHPLPIIFPLLGTRLMLPAGVYSPFNAQATLLNREVAAAALMPVTVHGRVSDIWRSYIMQRVMWDSGCRLTFADPWVKQYRNAHGYLKDFQAELDLYLKTEGLLQVLDDIDFGRETALGPRVLVAFKQMYEYGLLQELDVKLAYAYLRDLGLINTDAGSADGAGSGLAAAVSPAAGLQLPATVAPGLRAAVCLTGKFRGGPSTLPLFKLNVLEVLGMPFDIIVVTPDEVASPNGSGSSFPPEDGGVDALLYLLPNVVAVVHPDYSNVSALANLEGWSHTALSPSSGHNPAKLMAQLTDVSACNEGIRSTGARYTHVLRVRADVLVMTPLPVPLREVQPGHVVVPDNEEYGGVNDRYAYGRIEDMTILLDEIHAIPELLTRAAAVRGLNAEMMMKFHGEARHITFVKQPIVLCRVRDYRGGIITLHFHDGPTYPACTQFCVSFQSCQYKSLLFRELGVDR